MQKLLVRTRQILLDSLFPLHCLGCGKEGSIFCPSCEAELPRLTEPCCPICARPNSASVCAACVSSPPEIGGIGAPYLMDGPVREAVHRFKYR